MKIKYNNLLIITPIFFTIALTMSLLDYQDEKRELKWGMKAKAESVGIPARIFIEHMLVDKDIVSISGELEEKFAKILKYEIATRISISKNNEVIIDTNKDADSRSLKIKNLKETKITDFFIENDLKLVTIHIPINTKEKNLILSIDIDGSTFYDEEYNEILEMGFMVLFSIFLGIITSMILSKIVISKIDELNADAAAIASGNYKHNSYVESIREFTDLGDTLNIMKSIMNEIIAKTKNTMLKEDKFQDDDDLVRVFHTVSEVNKVLSVENIDLYIASIGARGADYFYEGFVFNNKIYAYVGKVRHEETTVNTLLSATTVSKYVREHIKNETFDTAKMSKVFDVSFFELISIDVAGNISESMIEDGKQTENEERLKNDTVNFKCMKNSSITERLDTYINNYEELTLNNLIEDLPIILENKEFELFILFQKNV